MSGYIMGMRKLVGHIPLLQCGASVIVENENGEILLQQRTDNGCWGYAGGSVELYEVVEEAARRELEEETGLTVSNPKLCGVKQFPIDDGRYIVFLFTATEYSGELISSDEGAMHWVNKDELASVNAVSDLNELLQVMLDDNLSEFQYVIEDGEWKMVLK